MKRKEIYLIIIVLSFIINCGIIGSKWKEVHKSSPQIQRNFESKRWTFYKSYDTAPNEIKKSSIWVAANKWTKSFANNNENFINWAGKIVRLETDQGGDYLYLSIVSSKDGFNKIYYKTWNNSLSDIGHNTVIKKGSTLYNQVANFKIGDFVKFSGEFIKSERKGLKEASLTEEGSLQEPEFIVRFK